MAIKHLLNYLIMFLIVALIGYMLVVIREKYFLYKRNTIIIDNKAVTDEHLKQTNIKKFTVLGVDVKSGDEVKISLLSGVKLKGILIGANKDSGNVLLLTNKNDIKKFKANRIAVIKIISKYGKFF
ncbi:MAG: hypothetical protein FH751_06650 [Firmicutes bacterium]|nr:hypothetical protein [Bacillota bacterium]